MARRKNDRHMRCRDRDRFLEWVPLYETIVFFGFFSRLCFLRLWLETYLEQIFTSNEKLDCMKNFVDFWC